MNVLLSIKPEYSKRIFSGKKKYEFRKIKPKFMVDMVFVYESSPTQRIVGGFSVKRIHSGSPDEIWQKCQESSGIEKKMYQNYCNGTEIIHADLNRAISVLTWTKQALLQNLPNFR